MLRPMVVGVDGSRESSAAADWAAREALRRDLPLRIVHAWEGLPADDAEEPLPELKVPQYWARRVLRTTVEQLGVRYPKLYAACEQVRLPPGPALLAEAENAELLVLGSQGLGGVSGVLAGSVAMATAAHAPRPVVLVRAGYTAADEHLPQGDGKASPSAPPRDVAVAVDLARPSGSILEFAFRAAEFRHAPLRVVHAWRHPLGPARSGAGERAATWAAAQSELAAALQPWREKFPGVFVHETLAQGRAPHEVTKAAGGSGLLVVGRRIRRAATGSHLGPVTHAAIHHVTCPVVVVPHD
ncbi:universal stress protein [Streptomyces sp. NPDC050095]|uniref:universal stress protein n=1 Tax=unclassified Streptomyces TaxID=2593676 RepID=UPI00343FF6E9